MVVCTQKRGSWSKSKKGVHETNSQFGKQKKKDSKGIKYRKSLRIEDPKGELATTRARNDLLPVRIRVYKNEFHTICRRYRGGTQPILGKRRLCRGLRCWDESNSKILGKRNAFLTDELVVKALSNVGK